MSVQRPVGISAEHDLHVGWPGIGLYWRRLRATAPATLVWAAVGGGAGALWTLPQLSSLLREHGVVYWLARGFLPSLASALMLFLAIGAGKGSELARKPLRFAALLALGASAAVAAVFLVDWLLPIRHPLPWPRRLLSWWLTIMLFGASFGWAAVLNMQRVEIREKLALLLGRRSTLGRQLVQARLFAARAQIDPELVARVLRKVREHYRVQDGRAHRLLEQLIAYLRLAMGRTRDGQISLAAEFALVRAYACLREVEIDARIEVRFPLGDESALGSAMAVSPLFVLARKLLDAAPSAASRLQIDLQIGWLTVELDRGTKPMADACWEQLRADLGVLVSAGRAAILHHFSDSGIHRYVVETAIE